MSGIISLLQAGEYSAILSMSMVTLTSPIWMICKAPGGTLRTDMNDGKRAPAPRFHNPEKKPAIVSVQQEG